VLHSSQDKMPDQRPGGPPFTPAYDLAALTLPFRPTEPEFGDDLLSYPPPDTDLLFDWDLIDHHLHPGHIDAQWDDPVGVQPPQVIDSTLCNITQTYNRSGPALYNQRTFNRIPRCSSTTQRMRLSDSQPSRAGNTFTDTNGTSSML
jgi:hypothetical protein